MLRLWIVLLFWIALPTCVFVCDKGREKTHGIKVICIVYSGKAKPKNIVWQWTPFYLCSQLVNGRDCSVYCERLCNIYMLRFSSGVAVCLRRRYSLHLALAKSVGEAIRSRGKRERNGENGQHWCMRRVQTEKKSNEDAESMYICYLLTLPPNKITRKMRDGTISKNIEPKKCRVYNSGSG